MNIYIQLSLAALLPVFVSCSFYLLDHKTIFKKLPYWAKQAVIGVVFGGVAVLGTEYGVNIGGATANARDAAPLCAGLIFGAPAGIIAGLIGGIERWFSVLWGVGMYSRVACSLSTALAGIYAGLLRKYMFDNKRPSWGFGFATGVVMEVFHLTVLFLTHLSDAEKAFEIVKICNFPMILCNGISVMLAIIAVSLLHHEKSRGKHKHKRLSTIVQVRLLVCIVIAYFATSSFTFALQSGMAENNADRLLTLSIDDIITEINSISDNNLLNITRTIKKEVSPATGNKTLIELAKRFDIQEINIIDKNNIITASNNEKYIGYDMNSGEQSREFSILNDSASSYVQKSQPISFDKATFRKYAGIKLETGYLQVGYDLNHFQKSLNENVANVTKNRSVGETGYIIIINQAGDVVSDRSGHINRQNAFSGFFDSDTVISQNKTFKTKLYNQDVICKYSIAEGYYILAALPAKEAYYGRDVANYINSYMEVIVFAVLFALIYFIIKKQVVENIRTVNEGLDEITAGNLNVKIDVHSSNEFAMLSDDINSTVTTLKRYIAEAAAKIDAELEFARQIQLSSLPNVFPAFPSRTDFDVFASMDTAKEVGGDFYDFYFTDENKFAILVADVSGKGIPAAMFMMTAKTIIKNLAETGINPAQILTKANERLCENNDAGMFVTAWLGIIDLKTGIIEFANAGHNPPIVKHSDGSCEFIKNKSGLVLAGMDGMNYKLCETKLNPGDEIFVYTDGVTEATNKRQELYGEDRLISFIRDTDIKTADVLCKSIKQDVDAFVGDAEQFDDMTMLALKFLGGENNERNSI